MTDTFTLADVAPAPAPADDELRRVATLAELQLERERDVVLATRQLAAALTALRQVQETDLPDALRAVGAAGFTLENGFRVTLKEQLHTAQLTTDNVKGMAWMEEHGGKSLVKTQIMVEMDYEDIDDARALLADIKAHRLANRFKTCELHAHIHPMTLGAAVRELEKKGVEVPLDDLGAHRTVRAIIGGSRFEPVALKGLKEKR